MHTSKVYNTRRCTNIAGNWQNHRRLNGKYPNVIRVCVSAILISEEDVGKCTCYLQKKKKIAAIISGHEV